MKNKIKMTGLWVGLAGFTMLCHQAQANSSINFGGSYAYATVTGNTITKIANADVQGIPAPTGIFAGLSGVATFYTPISLAASSTTEELWSVGSVDFFTTGNTADVVTGSGSSQSTGLSGTGYAVDGSVEESGTWSLSLTGNDDAQLSFIAASTTSSVPDGGTTMMMLGGAFGLIGALRRKLGGK